MKVLLIGSGGREHALAWKLEQSPRVSHIFVAPGNGGIAASLSKVSCVDLGVDAFEALVEFAQQEDVTLVVPGPEVPLVNGIEAHFRRGEPSRGDSTICGVV